MAQHKLTKTEREKLLAVYKDPVKWARTFLSIFDSASRKQTPWIARWYQEEMLRDESVRKVYRCGRRIGKTETMVVEMLWRASTKRNYRVVVVTPYESQVQLIFKRLEEILADSPLVKGHVVSSVKSPNYAIRFDNQSMIIGFTAGNDGASVRGQRADWMFLDEVDYIPLVAYEAVITVAGERSNIGITMSSTPTGKRSHFYLACTDPRMGFHEHFHPSMHNPGWDEKLESSYRATLTEQGYIHEIEAEFGTQENGVFPKDKIDESMKILNYAYDELTYAQKAKVRDQNINYEMLDFNEDRKPPYNPFRTIGVDWDKYQAGSSIVVLEWNNKYKRFMIIKAKEVPRGEYSYDNAVKTIIEYNNIYKPAWIYVDAGAGEYQIERLHKYGELHPETHLKNIVKRFQFSNSIEINDPITGEKEKVMMKQFMVNQLTIAFERSKLILSPFDEKISKQLIDYEVAKYNPDTGKVTYVSENEHFVDALGLAYLATVQKFKDLNKVHNDMLIEKETTSEIKFCSGLGSSGINKMFNDIQEVYLDYKPITKRDNDDSPDRDPGYRHFSVHDESYRRSSMRRQWGRRSCSAFRRRTW